MKAVFCTKHGSPEVLQIREVEKPTPKSNEICKKTDNCQIVSAVFQYIPEAKEKYSEIRKLLYFSFYL